MKAVLRWVGLCVLAAVVLQLYFVGRIALMAAWAPESTAFQRSEAWRIAHDNAELRWRQQWVDYSDISDHLKRAVIAAEDDSFSNHDGIDWDALEKAREKNAKAEKKVESPKAASSKPAPTNAAKSTATAPTPPAARPPKVVGGSTITQQLAKNLFLSGERTLFRKGQEFALTFMLEALLTKQRILEIYLNSVEWGEGVFGAEAAAQHYFRKPASKLNAYEAARLAVMLPRPKYFEKLPNSAYLANRASTIAARIGSAHAP
jgi:monofunctional glycosyltransferase